MFINPSSSRAAPSFFLVFVPFVVTIKARENHADARKISHRRPFAGWYDKIGFPIPTQNAEHAWTCSSRWRWHESGYEKRHDGEVVWSKDFRGSGSLAR